MQSYLSLMSIPETSFHAETGKGSTWTSLPSFCFIRMAREKATCHPLSSPTQFPGCDSSGVSNRNRPLPPRRRRTSAAAQPPRRGRALPPDAAAFRLGKARPIGQGVSKRELMGNSQAAQAAQPSISWSNTNIARHDKRMPGETQRGGGSCCL